MISELILDKSLRWYIVRVGSHRRVSAEIDVRKKAEGGEGYGRYEGSKGYRGYRRFFQEF
jgi:hypothetical protein